MRSAHLYFFSDACPSDWLGARQDDTWHTIQERVLRESKTALLNAYNTRIGGLEGRGLGFRECVDYRGQVSMSHEFVDMAGHHELKAPENQMLVLLLMSWFVADQYAFYSRDIVASGRYGFDRLVATVVSDKLSGDDDSKRASEQRLRFLIDPEHDGAPIVLTRSPQSDSFSGDLMVDNLAGWLNVCVAEPSSQGWESAQGLARSGAWAGWHVLVPSMERLQSVAAVTKLGLAGTV